MASSEASRALSEARRFCAAAPHLATTAASARFSPRSAVDSPFSAAAPSAPFYEAAQKRVSTRSGKRGAGVSLLDASHLQDGRVGCGRPRRGAVQRRHPCLQPRVSRRADD